MSEPIRIGIFANLRKPKVWQEVPNFIRWIAHRNVEIIIDESLADLDHLTGFETARIGNVAHRLDIVLSFGGDGTLLRCVGEVANAETPVLGINLGGLGYLAELSLPELYGWSDILLTGQFPYEERMLLQAKKTGGNSRTLLALNDFVFDRGHHSRTIHIRIAIDGEYLNTYTADGIILATPTGSTGYSLSGGGPILEPTLDALIIHPICPHTLAHRPMVIRSDRTIAIETEPGFVANVMSDGEYVETLEYGELMEVRRAPFNAKLVNYNGKLFYQVLREKLHWGEDTRHLER